MAAAAWSAGLLILGRDPGRAAPRLGGQRGGRHHPGQSAPAPRGRVEGPFGPPIRHGWLRFRPSNPTASPVHGSGWYRRSTRPTLVAYTRADLALWARTLRAAWGRLSATRASTVHNAYGYGLFTGGLGIHQGAVELGATVVPVSGGFTARRVTSSRDLTPRHPHLPPGVLRDPAGRGAGRGRGHPMSGPEEPELFGAERRGPAADPRPRRGAARPARPWTSTGWLEVIGPGVAAECLEAARTGCASTARTISWSRRWTRRPARRCPTACRASWCSRTVTREALPLLRYRTGDVASLRHGTH